MIKRIDSGLFARLMRLSAGERSDILEFLGQSPVAEEHVVRVVTMVNRYGLVPTKPNPKAMSDTGA